MANMLASIAQFESQLKSERTYETLASLKKRNLRYYATHRWGSKIIPKDNAKSQGYAIPDTPGRTICVPDEDERNQIRQFVLMRAGSGILNLQDVAALAHADGWKDADGTPWTKLLPNGKLCAERIVRAVRFYKRMIAKHGVEAWEDWSINATSPGEFRLRAPRKSRATAAGKVPGGAFRVAPEELDDELFQVRLPPSSAPGCTGG